MRKIWGLIVGLIVFVGAFNFSGSTALAKSPAAPTGKLTESKLAFSYADESGKRLLGFNGTNPKRFGKAIYAPGKVLNVKFAKHQKGSDKSTGRQLAYNFDRDEGELFNVVQGTIKSDESVLLAEKDAFQGHTFLKYKPVSKGTFSKSVIGKIEKSKKRKVISQGLIGQVSAEVQIGLVQFERLKGQKPLASLVLTSKSGLVFEDFVGNDDEMSTWRVADGGTITTDMFNVLFVTHSKAGYSLGYEWWGDEGLSLNVVQQQGTKGSKFLSVLNSYRYTVPL
ncbi:hypothetical protein [Cohnella cholangitidis]|uniref:Uncharacterized protein n=1 Tax=Cohnella cholangitidis TaxID=2598458 RepID=A0A7G5BZN3_9BACL|nr:hypothetical protein [Cohnella cholangitidis]QMV42417.1 hypothetical protein FPL14_15340 [Cohnella cholangitidis]